MNHSLFFILFPAVVVKGEDRKIVLLKDVFERFPDMPINVDIKDNNDELIEKVRVTSKSC